LTNISETDKIEGMKGVEDMKYTTAWVGSDHMAICNYISNDNNSESIWESQEQCEKDVKEVRVLFPVLLCAEDEEKKAGEWIKKTGFAGMLIVETEDEYIIKDIE
jgi:hypothetical protein